MYVINSPVELIAINSAENVPSQYIYQLSHELGHVMSQAWKRFEHPGQFMWIEEALCGAYSIYALRSIAELFGNQLSIHATAYLRTYIDVKYKVVAPIDHDWFKAHMSDLVTATELTDVIKPLSMTIANEFKCGEFVSDNVALSRASLGLDLESYLREWSGFCQSRRNVPEFLMTRVVSH